MSKVKVLDLASEVGVGDEKLLQRLKRMGMKVKNKKPEVSEKAAPLSDEKIIEKNAEKEVVEKRVKPTVIRRRTRSLEIPTPPSPPPVSLAPEVVVPKEEIKPEVTLPKKGEKEEDKDRKPSKKPPGVEKKSEEIIEIKAEVKEIVSPKPPSGMAPPRALVKEGVKGPRKAAEDVKQKEVPTKKLETKFPSKEELLLQAKKKGIVKKRRLIEERMVQEEDFIEDKKHEKEGGLLVRPFKPFRKKLVLKSPRKTEITVPKPIKRIIRIAEVISVGDLAKRVGVKGGDLIKKLMDIGVMVTINQMIDADVASLAASEFGYEVERVSIEHQELLERKEDRPEELQTRPPVVTIMGHVDHGKTMLLDAIRTPK